MIPTRATHHRRGPDPVKASVPPPEDVEDPAVVVPDWLPVVDALVVVVVDSGGALVLNVMGTGTLSPPMSPTAMTQPSPAATCAAVGGQG